MQAPMGKPAGLPSSSGPAIKGEAIKNQPFDLAVDVNDSEEIDSEEEEDEVNVEQGKPQTQSQSTTQTSKAAQQLNHQ